MREYEFASRLAPMIEAYLENRRKEGYGIRNHLCYLYEFDCMCREDFDSPYVTEEMITAWDRRKPHLTNRTKITRHNIIRDFAIFARRSSDNSFVPDTSRLRIGSTPYSPYIFTHDEIQKMIDIADSLPIRSNYPIRHLVIPAVLRTLSFCGLRISEALSLKESDVNFESGIITIRSGKGGKFRYVPMHESLTEYLKKYVESIQVRHKNGWLFPSREGHYSSNAFYSNFRELLFQCGIPHTGHGPRVHDLRHTFAVHSLEYQIGQGYDPMAIIPRLAAYLGHKTYRETCWYLHLTVAAFPELSDQLDAVLSRIIPEGGIHYEEN